MSAVYVIPLLGTLSFFTPCMWNLNLLFRAYIKKGNLKQIPILFASRLFLFNLIASIFYFLSKNVEISENTLIISQTIIAFFFLIGFPLMKKVGFAPFDISLQFFFPNRKFPPGLGLGFSIPYCAIPFIALLGIYSLYFKIPFILFNIYALFVTLPTLILPLVSEKFLRIITNLIPSVPAITGFSLILALGFFIDFSEINLYIASLTQEKHSVLFLIPLMFILGFLTSLGPSTLPFLPVVFGILISKQKRKMDIFFSVLGFSLAFLITHAFVGFVSSLGSIFLSDLFKTSIFNLFLSLTLLIIALNLLNVFSFSFELSRLNPFSNPGTSSFIVGFAYTFSLCPSCTSLFLGSIFLSLSTGNALLSATLMSVYAIGRAVPVFLSGIVVSNLSEFLRKNYAYVNKLVGIIFLTLSVYFFKKFLEVGV